METGPPTRTQPQSTLNDGWRKVTLTVPNGKMTCESGDLGETPIAPPRRKRSSVIDRQPCGFKELFGNNVSRRSSCDSILKDDASLTEREQEMLQQKRKSKSISDFNLNELKATDSLSISTIRIPVTRTLSLMERAMVQQTTTQAPRPTLQRKVSRVGNKKSDKFFGENLSDCLSDDPITPEPEPTSISFTYHTISTLITPIPHSSIDSRDKTDAAITDVAVKNDSKDENSNVVNEISIAIPKPFIISERVEIKPDEDRKTSLDKKAEFLMAMLEGTNISYAPSTTPAEPKVMTPPRRSHFKKKSSQVSDIGHANIDTNDANDSGIGHEISTEIEPLNQSPEITLEISTKDKESNGNNSTTTMAEINANDDDFYSGMTPVEEPIIVPRRRSTKHICDDDHHHHHIHKHVDKNHVTSNANENKENEPKVTTKESAIDVERFIIQQVTNPPVKPQRDLSVYERTHQNGTEHSAPSTPSKSQTDCVEKPPRVRHLSQENLMSKKILKTVSNDTIDLLRIKSMQNNNNRYDIRKLNGGDPVESKLKKYTSQQSFFTQELLSQIADRVYGFQDPFDTLESDDGSLKCTPNSKLTTRKISAHRKESTVTRPILECDVEGDSAPKIVQMEQKESQTSSSSSSSPNENDNERTKNPVKNSEMSVDEEKQHITNTFISTEREHSKVCDTIEKAPIVNEIPKVREFDNTENMAASVSASVDQHDVLDDIYKVNSTILHEFHKNFENSTVQNEQSKSDSNCENGNSSDDENTTTDSDTTVKEVPVTAGGDIDVNMRNVVLKQQNGCGEKRGSIVEVDAWFLKHNDLSTLPRRGSESFVNYDTRKVFPFGKSDPGAGSQFFDMKTMSKSTENMLNSNITKVELKPSTTDNFNETPSATDHSILLKYLKETY